MAYAVRFIVKWQSSDGNAYQLWLEQDGYGGSSEEISGGEKPCSITWGRRGIDLFTPIRASFADMEVWRKTASLLDDLLDTATHEFRARVVVGTTQGDIDSGTYSLYWLGYLMLDNYEDSTTVVPDPLRLQANDGLAELKNIPYTDASGDPEVAYTGREAIRVIGKRCLDKIGYALPYRTASRFFPDGEATNVDPWAKLEVDNAQFYDDEGNAMSCYQVLQQLCYEMTAQLYQRDGEWHFTEVGLQETGAAYTVYKYDDTGAADGTTTDGTPLDADTVLAADTAQREQGRRNFLQPVGLTSVQFNHGLIPSLIRAGDFEGTYLRGGRGSVEVGDEPTDYWTLSTAGAYDPEIRNSDGTPIRRATTGGRPFGTGRGGGYGYYKGDACLFIPAFFHGTSRDPATVEGVVIAAGNYAETKNEYPIETGQQIVFQGNIKIPHNAGAGNGRFVAYWRLEIDGAYYGSPDGSWTANGVTTEADRTFPIVPEGTDWGTNGLLLDQEYSFAFVFDAAPADGDMYLKLWGTTDVDGSDLDPEGVEWDDIEVLIVDSNGDQLEATLTEVWTGDPDKDRRAIELYIGPGPTSFVPSRVTWNGGTYYTDFVSDHIVAATGLHELVAETWLRFMNAFLERRQETYKSLGITLGVPVSMNSRTYVATCLTKDLRHDRDEVELVRLVFDGVATLSSDAYAQNVNNFSVQTGSVSASGSTSPSSILNDLAGYISTQNPIALVDAEYEDGDMLSVLTVDQVTDGGLLEDDQFVVVDFATAKPFLFQMSADEADVTWDVEDPGNPGNPLTLDGPIAAGSGIYFSNAQLLYIIRNLNLSPITTKGDLIVGDAAGADERLGVGADYRFLWARAAATLGVEWSSYSAPSAVVSGTFTDNDGNTITVVNGWITDLGAAAPAATECDDPIIIATRAQIMAGLARGVIFPADADFPDIVEASAAEIAAAAISGTT